MKLLNLNLETIPARLRCRLIVLHLQLLRFTYKKHPIPLIYWFMVWSLLKIISRSSNLLFPPYELLVSTGAELNVPDLQQMLWTDVLGLWTLDQDSIELIWQRIQWDRPNVVVECGAGVSTMVLAKHAVHSCSSSIEPPMVISLEQ